MMNRAQLSYLKEVAKIFLKGLKESDCYSRFCKKSITCKEVDIESYIEKEINTVNDIAYQAPYYYCNFSRYGIEKIKYADLVKRANAKTLSLILLVRTLNYMHYPKQKIESCISMLNK